MGEVAVQPTLANQGPHLLEDLEDLTGEPKSASCPGTVVVSNYQLTNWQVRDPAGACAVLRYFRGSLWGQGSWNPDIHSLLVGAGLYVFVRMDPDTHTVV